MESRKGINDIQNRLQELSEDIESVYYTAMFELRKEITKDEQEKLEVKEELSVIYESLSFKECADLVKKKLPLWIRLFAKVYCHQKSLSGTNIIIGYGFKEFYKDGMYYEFELEDFK